MEAKFYKGFTNLLDDYHLLSFDALDSTNEEAKRLAKAGGAHGAVVWAKKQTGGKGRMGRSWVSEEGNLFVSVLLKPQATLSHFPELSFVASLAVVEALADMFDGAHKLTCKWPNDVLLDGKKLAGVLLETYPCETDGKTWIVVGVGVNVDSHPEGVMFPATCLTEAGVELVSAKIVLSRFIHHFIECYNEWENKGFVPIRKRWLKLAWGIKKQMSVQVADDTVSGTFKEIDAAGHMVLTTDDGPVTINAGDVLLAPAEA